MREVSDAFAARLAGDVTTLCTCWVLNRRDGLRIGFTDHDRDLSVDGVLCSATAGIEPGAIEGVTGMAANSSSLLGALSVDFISADDLERGLWDGCQVRRLLVDWEEPSLFLQEFIGRISEVRVTGEQIELEVVGLTDALSRTLGRTMMRQCDAVFGDVRCGLDSNSVAYRGSGVVSEVIGPGEVVVTGLGNYAEGFFALGRLSWLTGANAGTEYFVDRDESASVRRLTLGASTRSVVVEGDTFDIVAGCDKRLATCRDTFSNLLNFRGFPHLPGEDWGMGYPQGGQRHDGSSLFR
jgi:uncharacterized phage protein (TIGR02218 family)